MKDYEQPQAPAKNKGGRPRKPINTDAPEFKDAVNAAVEAATAKILESFAHLRTVGGAEPAAQQPGDRTLARQIALGIAEIADQGTQRKRVAPEILAQRAQAAERMGELIIRAHASSERPEYRVISKVYFNERVVEPFRADPQTKKVAPTEIFWNGVPNDRLRPLNDVARAIWTEYMASIGGATALTPNADRRPVTVTPGGLVIKGEIASRRMVSNLADSNNGNPFSDDLEMKGPHDPTAREVHVLGTVAPPARQNYAGETAAR